MECRVTIEAAWLRYRQRDLDGLLSAVNDDSVPPPILIQLHRCSIAHPEIPLNGESH